MFIDDLKSNHVLNSEVIKKKFDEDEFSKFLGFCESIKVGDGDKIKILRGKHDIYNCLTIDPDHAIFDESFVENKFILNVSSNHIQEQVSYMGYLKRHIEKSMINVFTKIFHFNRTMSEEEVVLEMDKENFEPANILELLIFAITHPGFKPKILIVGMGNHLYLKELKSNFYPVLYHGKPYKGLGLRDVKIPYTPNYHFLGVYK